MVVYRGKCARTGREQRQFLACTDHITEGRGHLWMHGLVHGPGTGHLRDLNITEGLLT
jgi:hypothetical protein